MPQSLSAIYVHLTFSTTERRVFLGNRAVRDALHPYLGAISKRLKCPPIRIGGWEDHVHVLARLARTITQAVWAKEVKRVSNLWLKEQGPEYAGFQWQGGYACFSVNQSNLLQVEVGWPIPLEVGEAMIAGIALSVDHRLPHVRRTWATQPSQHYVPR